MSMLRLRRYRVFLICAVLMIVLIVRFKRSEEWDGFSPVSIEGLSAGKDTSKSSNAGGSDSPIVETTKTPVDVEHLAHADDPPPPPPKPIVEDIAPAKSKLEDPITKPNKNPIEKPQEYPATNSSKDAPKPKVDHVQPTEAPAVEVLKPTDKTDPTKTVPQVVIPDRKPLVPGEKTDSTDDLIHPVAPGRKEPIFVEETIHWKKQEERFPLPTESVIHLPTGKPLPMPKIQFKFPDETPTERIQREARQMQVKKEFLKAWNGYKTYAWLHDELAPVSGTFKDPFCGWAATLVDSLDTLWIMGLKDDFEEAVEATKKIDFTTCVRSDLPVFEVTIRYLGGLIAAYDVSKQNYKILLDKAVELGEVLMGVFDTPNRMPLLLYQWKPAFSSQAHRASTRSNLAELGSLSVEFTRLSQLTNEPKYYDAVARITNALEDWQKRGTRLSGVFPEDVDASGCNRTMPIPPTTEQNDPLGHKSSGPKPVKEPKPKKGADSGRDNLELKVIPGSPAKGSIRKVENAEMEAKAVAKVSKRNVGDSSPAEGHTPPQQAAPVEPVAPIDPVTQDVSGFEVGETSTVPSKTVSKPPDPPNINGQVVFNSSATWDCVPQGLDSPNSFMDHFSMGGSQDSTYEYFSKEYMLLGGHEEKYRTLYINTLDAVRKHMLYRPMVPGNADILFSGKVTATSNPGDEEPDLRLETEVTHLTCFLGGMVGMGAKLFDIKGDIEIAKKLTDGCVWAYSSMGSGVMAEQAQIISCQSVTDCTWNETLWFQHLDPMWATREEMIKDYDIMKAKNDAQRERDRIAAEALLFVEEETSREESSAEINEAASLKEAAPGHEDPSTSLVTNSEAPTSSRLGEKVNPSSIGSTDAKDELKTSPNVQKRQLLVEIEPVNNESAPALPNLVKTKAQRDREFLEKKKKENEEELSLAATGREAQKSSNPMTMTPLDVQVDIDPYRPLSHTAYVKDRIEREGIKPGYLFLNSDRYILRPEAIESVWYMYRITGDNQWQEKGWKMFESIIAATSTFYGHSAVNYIASGKVEVEDQMESFWLAETLKYFYLLYSTPDVISLDEWVLNTEAHPFRRPV